MPYKSKSIRRYLEAVPVQTEKERNRMRRENMQIDKAKRKQRNLYREATRA